MDDPVMLNHMLYTMRDVKDIPFLRIKKSDFRPTTKNKNAICYLVQNKLFDSSDQLGLPREKYVNRLHLFFDSLQHLLKNYVFQDHFDIHVFHEGDLTSSQIERTLSFSTNHRKIYVHEITFDIPSHINIEKVESRIKKAPLFDINGFRNMGYRHMCSFYSFYVYPLFIRWGYQKLMRLDDDSFLLDEIHESLFDRKADYSFRLKQIEDEKYMLYFKDCLDYFCQENMIPLIEIEKQIIFNNFFIVDLKIYTDPDVLKYLRAMYTTGGVYYCRWGDALIQSYIFKLWPNKFSVEQIKFTYKKWGYRFDKEGYRHMYSRKIVVFHHTQLLLLLLFILIIIGVIIFRYL